MSHRVAVGLHAVAFEVLDFLALEVTARHGDVRHLVAKRLDAVAGTRTRNRDRHVGMSGHKAFRGAVHGHRTGISGRRHRAESRKGHEKGLFHFAFLSIQLNSPTAEPSAVRMAKYGDPT